MQALASTSWSWGGWQARARRGEGPPGSARLPVLGRRAYSLPALRRLQPARAEAGVVEGALPVDSTEWRECRSLLEGLGLDTERADAALTKAFGWGGQAYWRQERVQELPSEAQLSEALGFLAELGMDADQQAALIKVFPEALGLDVQLMAGNVGKLQKTFFMKGAVLQKAILRKPRVLGSVVDCEGSCQGLCTRCFAQF